MNTVSVAQAADSWRVQSIDSGRERWLLMRLLAAGQSTPRLADRLIEEHGSLGSILSASEERLRQLGTDSNGIAILSLIRETLSAVLQPNAANNEPINSPMDLVDRFYGEMALLRNEQVRVAYLDAGRRLQRIEVLSNGTLRKSHIYPREIARRALELFSASVVLAHNHPSGDPNPSPDDIAVTRRVAQALETVDVELLDHLVIGNSRVVSFAASGLI